MKPTYFPSIQSRCASLFSRSHLLLVCLSLLLVALALFDLCSGARWISCFSPSLTHVEQQILFQLRLPKMLTAILAGAALSISGLMLQTLFRNPLAGPYILGVSSGASLGVALVTIGGIGTWLGFLMGAPMALCLAAIFGSVATLLIVVAVARRLTGNVSLLLVGMMIGAIAGALVNVLQNFANPDALKLYITWTFGSLSAVGWGEMYVLLPVTLLGLLGAILLIKPLDGLRLGENYAAGLGVDVQRARTLIVLVTGILAGVITAFCGPIAFIGVAVPHIARGLFRTSSHRLVLPASALIGADMLLVCDILSSIFTYPLPISTLSSLFGAPIIIWIIFRKK